MSGARAHEADPFDLPEWLGAGDVTWTSQTPVRSGWLVRGSLGRGTEEVPCDLLAADHAYPEPVLADDLRASVHQAWQHGQVLLLEYGGRSTLGVPATAFTADLALEALTRLAKAVGAKATTFSATLRL